jgi:hypothetical protein
MGQNGIKPSILIIENDMIVIIDWLHGILLKEKVHVKPLSNA